jgi:hypothetical protein
MENNPKIVQMEDNLKLFFMEDKLNFLINGRVAIFSKMEDNVLQRKSMNGRLSELAS